MTSSLGVRAVCTVLARDVPVVLKRRLNFEARNQSTSKSFFLWMASELVPYASFKVSLYLQSVYESLDANMEERSSVFDFMRAHRGITGGGAHVLHL